MSAYTIFFCPHCQKSQPCKTEWFGWTFRNTHTKWWIFNMSTWKLQ